MDAESQIISLPEFTLRPIGVIHTPFKTAEGMPIQASRSNAQGEIELLPEFAAGLDGLDDLSHLILIYVFHQALHQTELMVQPFLDNRLHGVFATRYFKRPNSLGISVVELIGRSGCQLRVDHVDMLDGTPLLDIKPYVSEFDTWQVTRPGWYGNRAHA